MNKKDFITAAIITVFAALLIFVNLAGTSAPETFWDADAGASAAVELKNTAELHDIRVYAGIPRENGILQFRLYNSEGLSLGSYDIKLDGGTMYTFRSIFSDPQNLDVKRVTAEVMKGKLRINEIYLVGLDKKTIDLSGAQISGSDGFSAAFDEQGTYAPDTHKNNMMFDEIYHARTAYEHIHRLPIYETTHPPLGKTLISIGIRIFGMNALGWRIIPALFGLLTVPLLYFFVKKLFNSSYLAAAASFMLAIDGMHLALSRIATLDAIAVFFMLAMYTLMLCFYKTNIRKEGEFKKALIYLCSAGVTFGVAAAVKWTNVYAGAGLFALFIIVLIRDRAVLRERARYLYYIGAAAASFVAIGGLIYTLSYIPYLAHSGKGLFSTMWDNQKSMLSYHSGISEMHNSQSAWYVWPLNLQGVFFYMGDGGGTYYRINMLGTTTMYWFGLFSVVFCGAYLVTKLIELKRKDPGAEETGTEETGTEEEKEERKKIRTLTFLFAGSLSTFVPWILVPRYTFAYHYYPSVIFMICMIAFVFREIYKTFSGGRKFCVIMICVFAANFLLALPALAGYPVSTGAANILFRWFSGSYGW